MRERYWISVNIKSNDSFFNLKKENLILDTDDISKVYKEESISDIFFDELKSLNITEYDIVNFESDSIPSIDIKLIDGIVIIASSIEFKKNKPIKYDLYINDKDFKVVAEYDDECTYKLTVKDGVYEFVYDFTESILYEYKTQNIHINIDKIYMNEIISSVSRDLVLNKQGSIEPITNVSLEKYSKLKKEVFADGIEKRNFDIGITTTDTNSVFDIDAFLTIPEEEQSIIFPKVSAKYKTYGSYNYNVFVMSGEARYKGTIEASTSGLFSIIKYKAYPISLSYTLSCECKYRDSYGFKTKKVSIDQNTSANLNNYTYIDRTNRTVNIDIKRLENDLMIKKGLLSILRDKARADGITGITDTYNYSITNIVSKVNNSLSSVASAYFRCASGDIDLSAPVLVVAFPGEALYVGNKNIHTGPILERTKVIDKKSIDDIKMKNQSSKEDSSNDYRYEIFDLTGDDYGAFSIVNGEVFVFPTYRKEVSGHITLNDDTRSKSISLLGDSGVPFGTILKATITVTSLKDIFINNEEIPKGQTKTLMLNSLTDGLTFSTSAVTRVEKRTAILDEVIEEASCNGIESTYSTEFKGKEDTTTGSSPFHVPSFGYNVILKTELLSITPYSAKENTTFIATQSNNIDYATDISLSSNYSVSIIKNITSEFVSKHKGFSLKTDQSREYNLKILYSTDGTYKLSLDPSNPAISLEYPETITIANGFANINVVAYASISKHNSWSIDIDPIYVYKDSTEYFMYNNFISKELTSGYASISTIQDDTSMPICVTHNGTNLTRITSNCPDGISVYEKLYYNCKNALYTKYNNILVLSVKKDGYDITYDFGENYIIPKCESGYVDIKYIVKDSFDYIFKNDTTEIFTTLEDETVDIFIPKRIVGSSDINPLNTFIDSGVIYMDDSTDKLYSADVYEYEYQDKFLYYIATKTSSENPYTGEISIFANSVKIHPTTCNGVSFIRCDKINELTISSNDKKLIIREEEFIC